MPSLFNQIPVSAEDQEKNNHPHRPVIVAAVLAVLALYIYLFTHVSGWLDIPTPESLTGRLGLSIGHVFDKDHNVDCNLIVSFTQKYINDDERFLFFLCVGLAFLFSYFLPVRYKKYSHIIFFLITVGILYGARGVLGLLFAHICVYLILHPVSGKKLWQGGLPGLLGVLAFYPYPELTAAVLLRAGLAMGVSIFLYRNMILPLLAQSRFAGPLRTLAVQSAVTTIVLGVLLEGFNGNVWKLPLGIFLFFWHWERLFMYHLDYQDGLVPKDLPLGTYLSVFLSPATIINWTWGMAIAQGYAYTTSNFLCEDKNKLILGGLRLWGLALVYLVFGDWFHYQLRQLVEFMGIPVFYSIRGMSCHFVEGGSLSAPTVLLTSLTDLARWLFLWGGVVHFKVGLWRICGYRVDPHFNCFWIATNLVNLWTRFNFHYRQFMVRAFYYPVLFRFFRNHTHLRIFAATMAAACIGNFAWGHIAESFFYHGLEISSLTRIWGHWPYFFLLALGIYVSEIWLMHKKNRRRKPWTPGWKISFDMISAYLTLQYFALIRIFGHPCGKGTVWDHLNVVLIGLGFQPG
ncbi:MAG: hypothetical protein ACE5E9_13580 [Nitrospinaceae bacterium]